MRNMKSHTDSTKIKFKEQTNLTGKVSVKARQSLFSQK